MKNIWPWLIFFFVIMAYGQEQQPKYSFDFDDNTFKEVFSSIEAKSGVKFFYAEDWLPETTFTKSYDQLVLPDILKNLFQDTDLNFFIDKDRIILTQRKIIYDNLPEGFFDKKPTVKDIEEEVVAAPVFVQRNERQTTRIPTIYIGKENRNNIKRRYQLKGTITDFDTGKPLPNIAILAKNSGLGTVSGNGGNYSLTLPAGSDIIEASSLGYLTNSKRVVIFSDGSLNFALSETREQLDEVVVRADALKNVESTTTGSANIDVEESKNIPLVLGERNVLTVATSLPGITSAGEGATGFNVRGGKTDQNLILLDDGIIYNPTHFFGIFQALNPVAIEDVNIYKGSIPVQYGGRLSSVFDINSKSVDAEKIKGEVSIGPITANAVVQMPIIKEKSGLMLGGRAAYSDWVLRTLNDSQLKDSQASFYDIIAKYDHTIDENNDIGITAYYSDDKFSITSDSLFGYTNRLLSAKWNHRFGDKKFGSLILNNSQYKFDIDFDGSSNANFEQSFQVDETELKLRFNYDVNDTHNLGFGTSAKLYRLLPGDIRPKSSTDLITELSVPEEKGLEAALFVSDELTVNDRLLLNLGLRYSFYSFLGPSVQRVYEPDLPKSDNTVIREDSFGNNDFIQTYGGPEARISARYLLKNDFSIKAGFDNTYQFIHTLTNNTTLSPVDTWKLSDTNIRPQQAYQFSLGLYKNINVDEYELSLEGFYKRQQDVLDFKTGAQLSLNEFVETEVLQGDGKSYGAELLLRKNQGDLNGWLSYTYSRSFFRLDSEFREERVNDGNFFPSNFDKPHDVSLVLNYKFSRRVSLSSNFVYQTGRPVTFPVGNYTINGINFVLYSDRNKFRIPDYYRLDLGINVEGNHKKKKLFHSYWSFSVYNVLGRNNPYSVFFVTEDGEIKALQSSIFNIPVPSITYNFRF